MTGSVYDVSMQKVVTFNIWCDVANLLAYGIQVTTQHNQFFSKPPTFEGKQYYFRSDE